MGMLWFSNDSASPTQFVGIDCGRQDLHFTIEDLLADGDKVVARVAWKGTHKGTLEGIAPTDKPVSGTATIVSRVADQKMQEDWVNWDALGLMQQIGAIPGPKQAAS